MECINCNDPICEGCNSHALPGFGYTKVDGRDYCEHCAADLASDEDQRYGRCEDCRGIVIRGKCACSPGPRNECPGLRADEYAEAGDNY